MHRSPGSFLLSRARPVSYGSGPHEERTRLDHEATGVCFAESLENVADHAGARWGRVTSYSANRCVALGVSDGKRHSGASSESARRG